MKKAILAVGIITLFIGMTFVPTVTSMQANPVETIKPIKDGESNGPGWRYFLFGRIKSYEIVEYEGEKYIQGFAICVRGIVWNVFSKFPNLPVPTNCIRHEFGLPYEGAKIIGPTLLGHYFIIAKGVLE